ncbi:hypothetical protein GCM10011504_32890 [Siccirubricoccus deserti]|uniref:Uncharacterized protein n=1 Tax=Siccirubricoccus deserti TaxID=2013562 RepID=A0A9X0UEE4_9PROT|nr:hypothetical protein [Siccirubricoccus deserti]MBC4016721.1 hypothetical protein [Siccirubricoccus deserti]GGC51860.1 hypothetical protein GCM10011504_32890 [Siccirubricoccus deserti]
MLRRALFAALLAVSAVGPAMAQSNDPSFRIINNSPNVVNEVYASPSTEQNWGQDRLGSDVIAPGGSYIVRLPADGQCVYDIRIVYQGNTAEERRSLNTCNLVDVVLGGVGGTAPPRQRSQPPQAQGGQQGNPSFNLVNQSGQVIEQFYASPSSENSWGPDRLGDEVVQPGARFAVRLPAGECTYDLRWVLQGGQAQERRRLNLCETVDYAVR